MLSICLTQIPDFLKGSGLYENFMEIRINGNVSDDIIFIPDKYIDQSVIINNFEDLIYYIRILNFWRVYKIPNEIYKWILENKDIVNMFLLNQYFGNIDLNKNILILINSSYWNLCYIAAEQESLDILKYGCENGFPFNPDQILIIAAKNGNLDILKYIHNRGHPLNSQIPCIAAKNNHVKIIKYACDNGCELCIQVLIIAAEKGHVEILKYAHDNKYVLNSSLICIIATKFNKIDILKYMHECKYPLDPLIDIIATKNNSIEILDFIHNIK